MITLIQKANTSTTTATAVTIDSRARYYHVGNSERTNSNVIKLASKKSNGELTEAATELQFLLNSSGRSYKKEANTVMNILFTLGLGRFNKEIEALPSIKSRRQLDSITEDVVYTICAAYVVKELDSKYIAVSSTVPELIKELSEGGEPELTEKQKNSIRQIAERKQSKDDTSAAWWRILKYLDNLEA